MCGIIGGASFQEIGPVLLEGLKLLEYRGYDSAGLAIMTPAHQLECERVRGKVKKLSIEFSKFPIAGSCGLAHTRWATHGVPSKNNAHPHVSHHQVAVVHNGIIENYEVLKSSLQKAGYEFLSETDSEVIAHLIHQNLELTGDLLKAVQQSLPLLEGMYAIGVMSTSEPDSIIGARSGSPLVIGLGEKENYIASDSAALLPVTHHFIYLEDGDIAVVSSNKVLIYEANGGHVKRKVIISAASEQDTSLGKFQHYMEKEIFEQPQCVTLLLQEHLTQNKVLEVTFGAQASKLFHKVENVMLVACGTSYHAAMIARYWLEEIAGISAQVEIASEYRYRHPVIKPNTLFIALSQSGETADTLAAFHLAKKQKYIGNLAICNVAESSLVREADLACLTHAGPEICVASTKAFVTQLVTMLMLTVALGRHHKLTSADEEKIVKLLWGLPAKLAAGLRLRDTIRQLAKEFVNEHHALFLGRGSLYPVAMEGALKLKEISYIHAEAYPAGELKHGPIAIVDKKLPVVVVAPDNDLFNKLKSNVQEVKARGGKLIVFADHKTDLDDSAIQIIKMPSVNWILAPILYVLPLQLLAYYVGLVKGANVDQPRNLAKSVTVE
ncbi:MAG: glutamine--fructose-6-phosphate transaminase (isomerizing) [Gammaproteobacteria bacterium]|nr:glutamine--fructose-6-phosphate transaminase (isomerizing) [Gammaproteobacteria bacterium]